ncbi:hypothetical protein [Nocardiopsis sp. HUAS JQ3]|uniref:hypothetical protein n=1 Tax=Nocardiopsis sp. HUAS JQ3 TaxID=3061629 RepID=UPI0023A9E017|nr:hypothetical protein [Nocardiopsis sp. HUAS JQ3]WDZ93568.1 hypothetical protein PV789_13935 [Nocardiopsis sp. HUAS JQ3]
MNPTAPAAVPAGHTMGKRLADYVLPKVPVDLLTATNGRAWVYPNRSLSFLLGGDKREGKRFNWRRPYFTVADRVLHCVVPPGRDYAHHYTQLIRAACALTGLPADVTTEPPAPGQGLEFMDHWLPARLPASDRVILGYVEPLLRDRTTDWTHRPGFGWRTARVGNTTVLLLGCEFSFWGDLAGDLVTALAARGHTGGVVYVGKLGGLQPDMAPNTLVVTGTTTRIEGHRLTWNSALNLTQAPATLRSGVRHATVPSVLDETRTWFEAHRADFDVVDPEIGHMARAATTAGAPFDYLHIVTDNLCGTYQHGLYGERAAPVATGRRRCLHDIETILHRSLA